MMTKEKKTFAWDTVLNMSVASGKMTVVGTDIEVVWCPATKMFWEIQAMNPVINVGSEENPMMVLCATTMMMMYEKATGKTLDYTMMDDYVSYCDGYRDGYNTRIESMNDYVYRDGYNKGIE